MSLQTKKRFKYLGKTIGIALFAILMFTNIKIAMMDDTDIASGDISLLGVELNLFDATYAVETGDKYDTVICTKEDGTIGWKDTCDNESGLYCLPGRGSGICI